MDSLPILISRLGLPRSIALSCLKLLLTPIVKFCSSHGLSIQELTESAKDVFVRDTQRNLTKAGDAPTFSRISVISGVRRNEVRRILGEASTSFSESSNTLVNVIALWQSDKRFLDSNNKPARLTYGSGKSDFNRLVELISKDINPATVLSELERIRAVRKNENESSSDQKTISLVVQSFSPKGDLVANFQILHHDIEDMLEVVESNCLEAKEISDHHARTEYTKIRSNDIRKIKAWLIKEGHKLHKKARDYLSKLDQDINPDIKYNGKIWRVTMSSFARALEVEKEPYGET